MTNKERTDILLQSIANVLTVYGYHVRDNSLFYGKGGIVMYLYAYAAYSGDEAYEDFAGDMLDVIMKEAFKMTSDFDRGFTGIGWLLGWLIKKDYVEGDVNDVLKAYDKAMFARIECEKDSDLALQSLYLAERIEYSSPTYSISSLVGIFLKILGQRYEGKPLKKMQVQSIGYLLKKAGDIKHDEKYIKDIDTINDRIRKEAKQIEKKNDNVCNESLYYSTDDLFKAIFLSEEKSISLNEFQTNEILENYIKNADSTKLYLLGGLAGLGMMMLENYC